MLLYRQLMPLGWRPNTRFEWTDNLAQFSKQSKIEINLVTLQNLDSIWKHKFRIKHV